MTKTKLFLPLFLASLSILQAKNTYTLRVNIDNLRNSKGIVQVALYNKDGSIPDKKYKNFFKMKKKDIKDNKAFVVFNNLKEGIYAVNVLHDENKNGKIDKGFILPKEGIGFSNFSSINIANKPSFKKASILIDKDSKINVKVIYF